MPVGGETAVIYNPTNGVVFARFDGSAATVTDYPVPPGATRIVDIGTASKFSLFQAAAATAGNVYLSRGDGSSF